MAQIKQYVESAPSTAISSAEFHSPDLAYTFCVSPLNSMSLLPV